MKAYVVLFVEVLPFLAFLIWGVRELVLLDRLKKERGGE